MHGSGGPLGRLLMRRSPDIEEDSTKSHEHEGDSGSAWRPRVFVSYEFRFRWSLDHFIRGLESCGADVLMLDGRVEEEPEEAIARLIAQSDLVVCVGDRRRPWLEAEVRLAAALGRTVHIYYTADATPSEPYFLLKNLHPVSRLDPEDFHSPEVQTAGRFKAFLWGLVFAVVVVVMTLEALVVYAQMQLINGFSGLLSAVGVLLLGFGVITVVSLWIVGFRRGKAGQEVMNEIRRYFANLPGGTIVSYGAPDPPPRDPDGLRRIERVEITGQKTLFYGINTIILVVTVIIAGICVMAGAVLSVWRP